MPGPADRRPLPHSQHSPLRGARRLGAADPAETAQVTISLRRRPDAPLLHDHAYWINTSPGKRTFLTPDQLAARHGATQSDLNTVTAFAKSHGLTVVEAHAGRRSVVVTGTVAQMNSAFGVTLDNYEAPLPPRRRKRGSSQVKQQRMQTHRGFSGEVQLPNDVADVVEAVFGLDNRLTGGPNGDPPNTSTLTITRVVSLYDFPTTSASGQTIGIGCVGGGYDSTDVTTYYSPGNGGAGLTAPTITPVSVNGGINEGDDGECIQDILISSHVAQGAAIYVYFVPSTGLGDAQAWLNLLNYLIQPPTVLPQVFSCSYFLARGDDTGTVSQGNLTTLTGKFQELAALGVTAFVTSGDQGSDCEVGDGNAHAEYPGSEPWATSCGGTTIGFNPPGVLDEVVWSDSFDILGFSGTGATGGGVSAFFPLPPWQNEAGVPNSPNSDASSYPNGGVGRGIPDVAGNASPNSGYPMFEAGSGAVVPANGTSAVAPLYAGLTAVLNAALGQQIGFLNPTLYAFANPATSPTGVSVFRDITSGNNQWAGQSNSSTPYFTAGPGWDACTGLGVVDGNALLSALQVLYQRTITVVTQKSTFGEDESQELGGVFPGVILVYVDGLKASEFPGGGITALSTGTTPPSQTTVQSWAPQIPPPAGTNIKFVAMAVSSDDPSLGPEVQRFTFTYNVVFPDQTAFTQAGVTYPEVLTITASLPGAASPPAAGSAQIELITAADPFFSNEANGGLSWLSEDLRAFYVEEGQTLFGLTLGSAEAPTPLSFIQQIISNLSGPSGSVPGSSDTFEGLPHASNQDSQLSEFPQTLSGTAVYNFALARVRLTGVTEAAAKVRVFFRTWQAQSTAITYTTPSTGSGPSPSTGPFRQFSDGMDDGKKVPLLGISPDGEEYITVPFLATPRVAAGTDMTAQPEDAPYNAKPVSPPSTGGTTYAYFGAWLDTNLTTPQFPLQPPATNPDGENGSFIGLTLGTINQLYRGLHQCLVAEIVDDEAPILNGANPAISDKLAQRNITFGPVANPGVVSSRLVTQPFEMKRPSAVLGPQSRPDELMIDWGDIPTGSVASIYLPAVAAADVLALAVEMYTFQNLSATDAHTIQCPAGGITYIPIPPGSGSADYVGLFSIELPLGIKKGQQFDVVVRQLTNANGEVRSPPPPPRSPQVAVGSPSELRWRTVRGSFQISVPVSTKGELLAPAEQELSLMKWVAETIPLANRWYPVFQRYLGQLSGRVAGLGGNPVQIPPSGTGTWPGGPGHSGSGVGSGPGGGCGHGGEPGGAHGALEGKIAELLYDGFGDFEGFVVETYTGEERRIESRERPVEELAKRAWAERIRVRVFVRGKHGHRLTTLVLLHP